MEEKPRFAAVASGKANGLLAGALKKDYVFAAALLIAAGMAMHLAGGEIFKPAFAEQSDISQVKMPAGNRYHRSITESMSVVSTHGSGSANSPVSHYRSMSESMSVAAIQGKAPNSYSRSMSEQASLSTGMPSSAPAPTQPARSAPAPYSASANQRIDERISPTLKILGKKSDSAVKNTIGGTPYLATESFSSMDAGSPDQFSETGEISGQDSDPNDNSALLEQIAIFNDYILMQQSMQNAALANASVSAVFPIGTVAMVVARQPIVSTGRLQKRLYAVFLLRQSARDAMSKKIANTRATYVLLLVLVIFTVSSIANVIQPFAAQAFAEISYVGVGAYEASAGNDANGDLIPVLPSGLQAGDVMIASYHTGGTTGSVTISAGWTQIVNNFDANGGIAIWYRVYQAGDVDPTITSSGLPATGNPNSRASTIAQVAAWRGVNIADPLDVTGNISTNSVQANVGPINGITLGASDVVIVLGGRSSSWTSVATLPVDSLTWIEIDESFNTAAGTNGMVWNYAIDSGSGTTVPNKTFTVTGGTNELGKGVMFSLNIAPQNFQASPSDTLGLTGTVTASIVFTRTVSDSLSATDTITKSFVGFRAASEQMALTDAAGITLNVSRMMAEQIGVTDSMTRSRAAARIITDQMAAYDAALAVSSKSITEQMGLTDSIQRSIAVDRSLSESMAVTNSLAKVASNTLTEQLSLTDQIHSTTTQSKSASDQLAVSDAIVVSAGKAVSESLGVADTIARSVTQSRSMTELMATQGMASAASARALSDQWGMTDAVAKTLTVSRTMAEQLGITDAVAKTNFGTMTEQMAVSENLQQSIFAARNSSESMTMADTLAISVPKRMTEQLSIQDMADRVIAQSGVMSEQMTITESVAALVSKPALDQLGVTETTDRLVTLSRSMTEQLTMQDTISTVAANGLSEQLGVTDTLARIATISRTITEQLSVTDIPARTSSKSITEQMGLTDSLQATTSSTIAVSEQLDLSDAISKNVSKTMSDSLTMHDSIVAAAAQGRLVSEQLSAVESVTKSVVKSISERLVISESSAFTVALSETLADQMATTDTVVAQVSKAAGEQLAVQDAIGRTAIISRSMTEQLDMTESVGPSTAVSISDQLGMTESVAISVAVAFAENFAISDSISATSSGDASAADQLGATESIAITVSKAVTDGLALSEAVMITGSSGTTESMSVVDSISRQVISARTISDGLSIGDSASGAPSITVMITDSMAMEDGFGDISAVFNLDIGVELVLAQGFANNFEGFFNQAQGEGIIVGDGLTLVLGSAMSASEQMAIEDLISAVQTSGRALTESMQAQDSLSIRIVIPPPPPPPQITTMPNLVMTQTEDADELEDAAKPVQTVAVGGTWNIGSLDDEGLESLLGDIEMPVYDVSNETSSSGIGNMTMVMPTFKVSMAGEMSDDRAFLTPTLSDLPAGMQVIVPINMEASMAGSGNLEQLGNMTVSFTPAVDAGNFTMLIAILDNNPEGGADEVPDDVSVFYIDVSIVGDFAGMTPSDEAFFEEAPPVTFTVTEKWVDELEAERDSNGVPIISLYLLDEGTGNWTRIYDIEPPTSAANDAYTYRVTLPHFSTYIVTAGTIASTPEGDDKDPADTSGGNRFEVVNPPIQKPPAADGNAFIMDLSESLVLSARQQPLHQHMITIYDVSVGVSVEDVRSAGFGSAVVALTFEITNKGDMEEEMTLKYAYSDPATRQRIYELEETIIVDRRATIVKSVEIPFGSAGAYNVRIEAVSGDGTLVTTDIAIDVPWLSVYLYMLVALAIVIVAASIAYVIWSMCRHRSFITDGT